MTSSSVAAPNESHAAGFANRQRHRHARGWPAGNAFTRGTIALLALTERFVDAQVADEG